jgi:Phosphotransferase enzyme family
VDAGEVTVGWLSAVLGGEVRAIDVTRIGDGLVGMNLRVRLSDADPGVPPSVVIKLPSPDPTSRATGVGLRNYEREVRFYLDLASTVDIRVPVCHHGEWDPASGDFVLVLEDMAGSEQGDQLTGCTVERAALTVDELVRLHGPRWDDPTLHDVDWLSRRAGPDDGAQLQMLWSMVVGGFLETYGPHLDAESVDLVHAFGQVVGPWITGVDGPLAVTHGDFRLDNLLYGVAGDAPAVTAVDWQTPGHGAPVGDLAYFLGAGLQVGDRRVHERALLDRYAAALTGYGVDLDAEWLWVQYRRMAFGGVIMAVVASQIVGSNDRSQAMFLAMAERHLRHALDVDALTLV